MGMPAYFVSGFFYMVGLRLCAHGGMQTWGQNYWETYAPVVNWASIQILLADVCINLTKPSKPIQTRPKTSNKFGRGKRRGGNRKTTLTINTILPTPQAADVGGVARHRPPAIAKKSTKKQLISSLNKIEKKRQMTEDKMVVVTKKCIPPPMIARLWQCWLKNKEGRATWLFNMPIASSPVWLIR